MTSEEYKTCSQACDILRHAVAEGIRGGLQDASKDYHRKQFWIDMFKMAREKGVNSDSATVWADNALAEFDKRFPNE